MPLSAFSMGKRCAPFELSQHADDRLPCYLALGLANYREEQWKSAADILDDCANHARQRDPFGLLHALEALAADARKRR
jgi:hypothetical protein